MARRLKSDQLGAAGEGLFHTLSERAQLVSNKSNRDVTGWDFFVQFPIDEMVFPQALDQRPANACYVQLKSTAGENGTRVSARLSAVEHLAKAPGPALIVVFRLRSDGEPVAGYLIHLLGDELARILKRLRQAEAEQRFDINHAWISFDYVKSGRRFSLTPDGYREAIENACSKDPASYITEKQRQLAELGYEDGGIEAEVLFRIEGREHLDRVLLGLVPIKPKRLAAFDARFGIRIPYRGDLFDGVEELTLTPPTVGRCRVAIRGGPFATASVFDTDLHVAPPFLDAPRLVLRHADFVITIEPPRVNFETTGTFDELGRTLEEWTALIRALSYLASGTGTLSVTRDSGEVVFPSLPVTVPLDGPYLEQLPDLTRFLEGWQQLIAKAGVTSVARFPLDAIWDGKEAGLAVDLLLTTQPKGYFEFESLEGSRSEEAVDAVYFNSCALADASISYSVRVTLEPTGALPWRYRSTCFQPLDVRPVVLDLDEYGAEQASVLGIAVLINPAKITLVAPS